MPFNKFRQRFLQIPNSFYNGFYKGPYSYYAVSTTPARMLNILTKGALLLEEAGEVTSTIVSHFAFNEDCIYLHYTTEQTVVAIQCD